MAVRCSFKNLTSSAQICAGRCVLEGMYVHSTSTGKIRLYHGTSTTIIGRNFGSYITPAVGYHYLGSLDATQGLYVGKPSGTIDVTFHIRETE